MAGHFMSITYDIDDAKAVIAEIGALVAAAPGKVPTHLRGRLAAIADDGRRGVDFLPPAISGDRLVVVGAPSAELLAILATLRATLHPALA